MNLKARLAEDSKTALKAGDERRLLVLRMLLAALHNKEIEKHGKGKEDELTDEETLAVVTGEAKKRRESAALFKSGGRQELALKEEDELRVLETYLPKQLSSHEVRHKVEEAIKKSGSKDFGALMKEAMASLKGQADGKAVAEIIRELITNN